MFVKKHPIIEQSYATQVLQTMELQELHVDQEPHRRAVPTWNGVAIAKAIPKMGKYHGKYHEISSNIRNVIMLWAL